MGDDLTREEVLGLIDRMVEQILDQAGMVEPPVDALSLARDPFGMEIRLESGSSPSRIYPRRSVSPSLVLDSDWTEEVSQWKAAQAIGFYLKPKILDQLGCGKDLAMGFGESLANLLAQRLLVPLPMLADEFRRSDQDLLVLKERFSTASHEIIALRLLDLPDPCIITIVDNGHVVKRRSNSWRVRKELAPLEKQVQQYVKKYSRPQSIHESGWSIKGWPIHESDWKREILRSVVDSEEVLMGSAGS